MKSNQIKNILIFLAIIFFIVSSLTPLTIGNNTQPIKTELNKKLEYLAFICTEPSGFNSVKYEHYKQQLIEQHSNEDNYDENVAKTANVVVQNEPNSNPSSLPLGPMDSPWPMSCHDVYHTGQSQYSTADNPGLEKWRFKIIDWVEGGPVIGSDGTIYFGAFDSYLYALYPNGTMKWRYKIGDWIWSTPAIADEGTIYVSCWGGKLYAINPDGTQKWRFPASGDIGSSPAIANDGTIYFGILGPNDYGRVYAINPNGTEKWHYDTGYWIASDSAIGYDGTIYIGSGDSYLYALYPNGTLRWRYKTDGEIHSHPSIVQDGTIYIGSNDGYLYAIYPNGTMRWRFNIQWGLYGNPSQGEDGTIYVGTDKLYAIKPNGTLKWSFNLGANRWIGLSSPAISADGTIYVGLCIGNDAGGEILAVNPNGTEKWRKRIANMRVESSPSINEDGTVYIGSSYDMGIGYLYAFGIGEFEADAGGPHYGLINQPVQFTGSARNGTEPYSWHWDFGDGQTSQQQNPMHAYTNPGNYTATLTVTDSTGNSTSDTTWVKIKASNTPPDAPAISGPNSGKAGTSYDYTFATTDPDNDEYLNYYIDWGDNSNSGWIGPYAPAQDVTLSHTWNQQGTYIIKAKASDNYGGESGWGTLSVTMPLDLQISQSNSLQLNQQSSSQLLLKMVQRLLLNIR